MGTFTHPITLVSPDGEQTLALEAQVDPGASFTQVPGETLRQLGIAPSEFWDFTLADGRSVVREVSEVRLRLDGREHTTVVIFGEPGSPVLLGAFTLERFRLGVDVVNRRLVPTPGLLLSA